MRGGKYLRSVCVERAIVDIDCEVDDARECQVLGMSSNGSIGEEEGTRHKGADDHGVSVHEIG